MSITPAEAKRLYAQHGSQRKAADAAGVSLGMLQRRLRKANEPDIEPQRITATEVRRREREVGEKMTHVIGRLMGVIISSIMENGRRRTILSHRVGPGQSSVIAAHKRIAENVAHNEARARSGRYNWNMH